LASGICSEVALFGFTDQSNETLATTDYHYWEHQLGSTLSHYASRTQTRMGHAFEAEHAAYEAAYRSWRHRGGKETPSDAALLMSPTDLPCVSLLKRPFLCPCEKTDRPFSSSKACDNQGPSPTAANRSLRHTNAQDVHHNMQDGQLLSWREATPAAQRRNALRRTAVLGSLPDANVGSKA
jgi:hypothetical protein